MFFRSSLALRAFVQQYALERGLSPGSLRALGYVLNSFERYLKRPARLNDLHREQFNAWLLAELAAGLDPETVRNRRTAMLGIWRHAAEAGLLRTAPARIVKIQVPQKIPEAWHKSAIDKLEAAARLLPGTMHSDRRVLRADFWTAYALVDYDLGIRLGDLLAIDESHVNAQGGVCMIQHKTQRVITGQLSDAALAALRKILRGDGKPIFGGLVNTSNAQRYMRKLVQLAGLKGSTKWLRKTGATWVEVEQPGSAPAYLGHGDRRTAYRHYVDPRHVQAHKPRPPR
ncbi:MAG: tyrosine-type recombinase/integrase [Pirellulales bacterium]